MAQFRKKPVVVDAFQIKNKMTVETLEGTMQGNPGDWLITGVAGEQYFCKDNIFQATYETVGAKKLLECRRITCDQNTLREVM